MKYCKICKTAAKETETHCAKGHPLTVFGAAPKAPPAAGPSSTTRPPAEPGSKPTAVMFTLLGEVQKLEETNKKNVKRGRAFALICAAAALGIAIILYQVYSRTVLCYAILDDIKVEQDPAFDRQLLITYNVKTPGKVSFDRQSGARRTEKTDVIGETGPTGFTWAWPADRKAGIDFHVRYRSGWLPASFDRHFDVSNVEESER